MNAAESSAADQSISRREVFAWALYDWASSAYSTILITILMLYIKDVVLPGGPGAIAYAWGVALSMFVAALLSPVLGALADARANKRTWLALTALSGSAAAIVLCLIPFELSWLVVSVFVLVCLCFELSLCFYNGFLPEITTTETINRVSAFGFGLGYIGGSIPLVVGIGLAQFGGAIGLPDGDALVRDFNSTCDGEFAVALPQGRYLVRATLGDAAGDRAEMQLSIDGESLGPVSTTAGKAQSVERTVSIADGELSLTLGAGVESDESVLNALEITGLDNELMLRFDFGTAGSAAAAGYLWLSGSDTFHTWTSEDLQRRGYDSPEEREAAAAGGAEQTVSGESGALRPLRLPADAAFGWRRGAIGSYDTVMPPRLRLGILIMGLWWGGFTLPTVLILRDRRQPPAVREPLARAAVGAVRKVADTLRNIRVYRTLALFLLGFLFFNDGIQTVINQASVFASEELDFETTDLILLILMIQLLALPGALAVGFVSDRLGQKPTLMVCLAIWVALVATAYFVTTKSQFWILGVILAMVMGGTQSVSRAIMGVMAPKSYSAEFFGFFNFSGKATSWMGSFLFGFVLIVTNRYLGYPSARLAIVSILVFFLIGWALVIRIDVARGRQEAERAP